VLEEMEEGEEGKEKKRRRIIINQSFRLLC
jgi:hypothetical protein